MGPLEEIFGPVVVVIKWKDDEDILALANESMYGLAAAVFSRDISRAITLAHSLHAGTVWVSGLMSVRRWAILLIR